MATIVYSSGGIGGNWGDPRNWNGGRVPGMNDNVQILNGASMTVGGPVAVNAIMIVRGGTDTFTGSVTTAGVGNCQGLMICVGSTVVFAPGASLHDGGDAASLNGGGVIQVGVGGVGNLIANGSNTLATTITSNNGTIGVRSAGIGTATIDNATWTMNQVLTVGLAGQGTLNLEQQGQVNVGSGLLIGADSGSVGTISVSAGGKLNVNGSALVGGNTGSVGILNVASGSEVTIGASLYLAKNTGASGAMTISSGSAVTVAGDAGIGSGTVTSPLGTGNLTINAGSTFAVGNRISADGGGTIHVAGGAVSAGSIYVGMTGAGTLNVDAGSHINLGQFFTMGFDTGASGTATLFSGSTMTVNGSALIGGGNTASSLGTGNLTVEGTATFSAQGALSVSNGSFVDLAGGTVSAAIASGNVTVAAGGQITGYGTLATRAGGFFIDNGKVVANGGTLQLDGKVSGTGSVIINPDSTVAITGTSLLMPTLTFMSGTNETLSLATAATVQSTIGGFAIGDQIEMAGIDKAVWSSAADTLTLSAAGRTISTLHLAGNYTRDVFSLTHTGSLGVITLHTA